LFYRLLSVQFPVKQKYLYTALSKHWHAGSMRPADSFVWPRTLSVCRTVYYTKS